MMNSTDKLPSMIPPSPWVVRCAAYLPTAGSVLDLACGNGRHARYLAGRGHSVFAVDRDRSSIDGLHEVPGIEAACLELEGDKWPLGDRCFDGIVVTNYLWRPRFDAVLALLSPGGVLIYETFMLGNEAYGKPSNPDFLLRPGELRECVRAAGMRVIDFVEGYVDQPKPAMRQAICAIRG